MKIRSLVDGVIANWPSKILALTAAVLLFVFNRTNSLRERELEIPLDVILPGGYAIAAPYQEKVSITIKGDDEASIAKIDLEDVWAYVDLTELSTEGEYNLSVRYTRRGPALQSAVFIDRVEPKDVSITLEEELEKSLEVKPTFKGSPKYGFILSRYTVSPPNVRIRGPRTRIASITEIATGEIALTGRADNFVQRVGLVLHEPFVVIEGEASVEFQAMIEKVIVAKEYSGVVIEESGLHESLAWEPGGDTGVVDVRGPLVLLDAVGPKDFKLLAQFSEISEPGEYDVAVTPVAPAGLTILGSKPPNIKALLKPVLQEKE